MQETEENTTVSDTIRPGQIPHVQDPDSDVESWERSSVSEDGDETANGERVGHEHQDTLGTSPRGKYTVHQMPVTPGHLGANSVKGREEEFSQPLPAASQGWDRQHQSEEASATPPVPEAPALHETNPFRRKMSLSNMQHRAAAPPTSTETPPPVPPSADLAQLNISETNTNPWQPVLNEQQPSLLPSLLPTEADQESARNVWASQVPSRAPSTIPQSDALPTDRLTPNGESDRWGEQLVEPEKSPLDVPSSFRKPLEGEALEEDSHAWDDLATQDKGKAPATTMPASEYTDPSTNKDIWNLIDSDPTAQPASSGESAFSAMAVDEPGPTLPTRKESKAPALPPRTPISTKEETYQVKNINWYDVAGTPGLRQSPILVQNANGPCPLMALVNALTLTTPVDSEDAVLVNTLKTREQISLDLLLDVVFDELMSERRMTPDHSLPDVTKLYEFLKGLHTGMNVNPRFVPTKEIEEAFRRTSLTHLHPTERENMIPGTFEETQEMSFYRIFQIPLIHGWLPSRDDPAYAALKRYAESYEDAQNILFREEELEDKLNNPSSSGLSEEEQNIYQDVLTIKSFLQTSATQLTQWGLEVITKAMRPGSVAILFRNDHFSTLYRHPQTLQIFTLVTDAGYSGHAEVVWESLVDVNGERSGFFSGDFRGVGGEIQPQTSAGASTSNGHGDWMTVQGEKGQGKNSGEEPPLSPKEQEDHDLALALQLQEEEDQRHRSEQAQRRREAQLSEQFIEQQAVRRGPVGLRQGSISNGSRQSQAQSQAQPTRGSPTPPNNTATGRGRGSQTVPQQPQQQAQPQQRVRPLVPPIVRSPAVHRPTDEGSDDAPPSYEDAAKDRPYFPPAGHPSHHNSSSDPPPAIGSGSGMSGSSSNPRLLPSRAPGVAGIPRPPMAPVGMRRGSVYRQGVPSTAGGGKDKDCIVM
ncbi:hypothetical protein BD289DRAFT_426135 [Coniella lustricola]|uniref:MINDY deubiquitinase domain-containing protein n=1 Tax=Coniella lustricola TaxID=2025994 RepID=A0A2T3AGJ3_9PEZI|nr:hypothetical protein BD289DRAFT_426135 [Coniella lustricola]